MLNYINRRWSIVARLALIACSALLVSALILVFLLMQAARDFEFTEREARGTWAWYRIIPDQLESIAAILR